jgi:membrane associated rhomboid family serine protease
MFAQFSARLYENAANNEYRLVDSSSEKISGAQIWIAEKYEMATYVSLNVIDFSNCDFDFLLENDKKILASAEGNFVQIYILAGGTAPNFDGVEEYFGQKIYSIFWHVNLETGEISVPKGQPKKIFNIREMVTAALNENEYAQPENFSEITTRAAALRPKPKYKYPVFSYAIILFNLAILGLMYLDGYNAQDISVPLRFGAIRADLVLNGEFHRLFAAMFIHFGFGHFFANSFGILIFGTRVEQYLGRKFFLVTYFFSGLIGSIFSLINLHLFHEGIISAGASGAVYGIIGAIFAYTRITKRSIEFINWYLMLIYIGIGIAMGSAPNIDNLAHIGGLLGGIITGTVYSFALKKGIRT